MEPSGIFQIDESSGVPIWIQIRKRLIYLIGSGHFKSSERLPSVREMSVRFGVNYNTINKVYQDLERDGYIYTKRGLGTYVAEGLPESASIDDDIASMADELSSRAVEKRNVSGRSSRDCSSALFEGRCTWCSERFIAIGMRIGDRGGYAQQGEKGSREKRSSERFGE